MNQMSLMVAAVVISLGGTARDADKVWAIVGKTGAYPMSPSEAIRIIENALTQVRDTPAIQNGEVGGQTP